MSIKLFSAGLLALIGLGAGEARAWTCESQCRLTQPGCRLYVTACYAVAEPCRGAALAASEQVRVANGPAQALTPYQKDSLRPFFGDLVDRVRVRYGALLAGETVIADRRLSWGYEGQTFGHDIYLVAPLAETAHGQLRMLAHELTHSMQYEREHGIGRDFFRSYCRAWFDSGLEYASNRYEQEARAFADWVASVLP
jgi:Domain of unknown function (DUF4157)